MALSKKALQKKREKKKRKRQIKAGAQSKVINTSGSHWPIYECWVPEDLFENGIGQVVISRKSPENKIAFGAYLIDTYCLGVKNCFSQIVDLYEYQDMLERAQGVGSAMQSAESSYVATLIYQAIQYAARFGLRPHSDYLKASAILKNIPIDHTLEFTFGKNGKPLYIQGPNESRSDIKRIMHALSSTAGKDNYHFAIEAMDNQKPRCGLCGSTKKELTKTPCCDNYICDDTDDYILFSYARNSCYRNHDRYTLCGAHFHENHTGEWLDCKKCKENIDLADYNEMGTNEYNFEVLQNPEKVTVACVHCGFTAGDTQEFALQTSNGRYCSKPECIEAGGGAALPHIVSLMNGNFSAD